MRVVSFYPFSHRLLQGAACLAVSAMLAGCSGNVTRFTDSLFTGSTAPKQAVVNKPIMADQQMPPIVNESIESAELAPPPQPDYAQSDYDNAPQPQQVATGLGAPPRNLGTLPADESLWDKTPQNTQTSVQTYEQGAPRGNAGNGKTYVVQSGDTLSLIASRTGTRVAYLKQANGLEGDMIRIGQKLTLPEGASEGAKGKDERSNHVQMAVVSKEQISRSIVETKTHASETEQQTRAEVTTSAASSKVEQPVETPISASSNETVAQSSNSSESNAAGAAADGAEQETQAVAAIAPQATGIAQLRWPARGRIVSRFGDREGTVTNDGLDIMVPEGTSVKAAENGVVIYAGDGLKEFGKTVLIRHEDNLVTVYGHNSNLLVKRGQQVRRGDEIAKSGMSGNATSPKLHFEVRKNSSPVNPVKYLEQ